MAGATKLLTAGGGGVILTPASSIASDVTVNVPSQNCTLGIQGPAFSAYVATNQSFTIGVVSKVPFNTEDYDTNSNFDTSLYRFTPTVAGYYLITTAVSASVSGTSYAAPVIYKNGSAVAQGPTSAAAGAYAGLLVTKTIYLNGSTDYVEIYFSSSGSGAGTIYGNSGTNATFFQAHLARSA